MKFMPGDLVEWALPGTTRNGSRRDFDKLALVGEFRYYTKKRVMVRFTDKHGNTNDKLLKPESLRKVES